MTMARIWPKLVKTNLKCRSSGGSHNSRSSATMVDKWCRERESNSHAAIKQPRILSPLSSAQCIHQYHKLFLKESDSYTSFLPSFLCADLSNFPVLVGPVRTLFGGEA